MEFTASASTVASLSADATLLFTDLEGSTRLWESEPEAMRAAIARHDDLLRTSIASHGGVIFSTGGDGCCAAFTGAEAALAAAVEAQRALVAEAWPTTSPLQARMAVHTGPARDRDGTYGGRALNRCSRILAVTHGAQIVCSQTTASLVDGSLPQDIGLVDLGLHHLRDLAKPERLFQLVAAGLPTEFPRLVSLDASPTNLPVQLTSFVGRDAELSALGDLLAEHRMVTLTGTGGVGKTRLAIHLAADLLDRFAGGVWLVELASVEAARVVEVMAGALGVSLPPGRTFEQCLIEELRGRELVIVLDNCEHLVREVRRVAEMVLREAPRVSLLATSREGLRISGEQLFSVPSLDDDAALRLFVERATAAESTFTVGAEDRDAVLSLCQRLDGMPLAIELAAARVRMFSVADLARRVDQRFRLLIGGRDGVERHQTLRAAIDWSYELLSPAERIAFARFAVFAGGCTLEAAEAVIADTELASHEVLEAMSGLIDKSLVVVERTQAGTRYDMLETIRQYAQERLVDSGDAEEVRARHARWYTDFARTAGRGLYSPDEALWLERLRGDVDNLQIAVSWSVGADQTELAMRLSGAFPRQAMARPFLGTAYLAEQALGVHGFDQHPLRARVLAEAAWAAMNRGDFSTANGLLQKALEAQRNGARYSAAAFAYLMWRRLWDARYELDEIYELAKEGLTRAEAAGDILGAIGSRINVAIHAKLVGHEDEAIQHARRALTDARQLHQPTLEAAALYANAVSLFHTDPASARRLVHESLDLTRRLQIESEQVEALGLLAALEARHGDARRGLEALQEQLASAQYYDTQMGHYYLGIQVYNRVGRPDLVARFAGHSRGAGVVAYAPFHVKLYEDAVQEAMARLGEETFNQHAAQGASIPREQFRAMMLCEVDELLATAPILDDQRRGAALTDEEALRYAEEHTISGETATETAPPP